MECPVMARLKSRTTFPPGEFQVLHPETGMREPFHGSFNEAVGWEIQFRIANPAIASQNKWTTDRPSVENYVDEYNALRCAAHGWVNFLDENEGIPELPVTLSAEKKTLFGSVVDKAKAIRAGAGTYVDMFGDGGLVAEPEAESRASGKSVV